MKRFTAVTLVFVLLLIGCEATRYVERGDAALVAGRPAEALANYKRALQKDPKLQEKPTFQAKLLQANWQTAFAEAQSYERQHGWEQAIAKYHETLRYKPGFQPAIDGIASAKLRGADARYESAINDASNGQLDKAANNLRRALELNPNHASSLSALASMEGGAPAEIASLYTSAQSLSANKQWQQAQVAYRSIIQRDRNHLPSRAALYKAGQQIDQSNQLAVLAAKQFGEQRLDASLNAASQSLAIWPNNGPAQQTLNQAKSQRDRAETFFVQAQQQKANQQWDAAIASAQQAKAAFPYHPSVDSFDKSVRNDAAQTYVNEGNRLLAAGELEAANNTFRAVFKYAPKHEAAEIGLAEVAHAHGSGAEKDGLPGNALLWYLDAQRQRPNEAKYNQAVVRTRAAVGQNATFQVAPIVVDANNQTNGDTAALQKVLNDQLNEARSEFVSVVDVNAKSQPKNPLFKAMVTMNRIQTQRRLVSSGRKTHIFTGYKDVPNPQVPHLQSELHRAERDLARARINRIRHQCKTCRGHGHINCSACSGRRTNTCGACRGQGKNKVGEKFVSCRACAGRGHSTCRVCAGRGQSNCNRCGGRGFHFDVDTFAISRAQRRVNDLSHQLHREPRFVKQQYQIRWPYTYEVHATSGEASATVKVLDVAANDKVINTLPLNPVFNITDSTILEANPKLGLQEDRLVLPSEAFAYNALLQGAAKKAVPAILEAAAVERANAFIAEANAQARAGRSDLDLEARMTAMVILETVRPKEAKKILSDIYNP